MSSWKCRWGEAHTNRIRREVINVRDFNSGQIASQVEGQPERISRAGESWYETPGAHHLIGRNAISTEPAKLLAVFIADTGDNPLATPDQAGGPR